MVKKYRQRTAETPDPARSNIDGVHPFKHLGRQVQRDVRELGRFARLQGDEEPHPPVSL